MKLVTDAITKFDYFGYVPQFRIKGNAVYKSFLGGIIFICFVGFAIQYLISQFYSYLSSLDTVKTSRPSIKSSENQYTITARDIYMGIGLVDTKQFDFDQTSFPYLSFSLDLVTIDNNFNKIVDNILLEPCDITYLLNKKEYDKWTRNDLRDISRKVSNYLCPIKNFSFNITPDEFGPGFIYLDFSLSFKNTSNLSFANSDLFEKRPQLNMIYKQINQDIDSKKYPFVSVIKNILNNIDFDYIKKTEIKMTPQEVMDDDQTLSVGTFNYFTSSDMSTQKNGTIFRLLRSSDYFEKVINRTIPLKINNDKPLLTLGKFIIRLGSSCEVTLRSFQKFNAFLANCGAILSNLLLVFVILLSQINHIKGTHVLLDSMFSNGIIQNIKKFNEDVKIQFSKVSLKSPSEYNKLNVKQSGTSNLDNIDQKVIQEMNQLPNDSDIEKNKRESIEITNRSKCKYKLK